jgi:hypothetical protein
VVAGLNLLTADDERIGLTDTLFHALQRRAECVLLFLASEIGQRLIMVFGQHYSAPL